MIVKKIKPDRQKNKSDSIRDLVNYVLDANAEAGEKLLHSGSRGFLCTHDQRDGQREEMVALAGGSTRSKNPVTHYVVSWREGEQPTPAQVDEAVNIFLDELKLTGHQVIYGLHQNTDNHHVHIVVNRVHPETGRVIEINRGFDIRAAHAAIARIEHTQGWQPEKRAIYQVDDNQQIVPRQNKRQQQKRAPSPRADLEHRTGEKSAVTRAIEIAGPIIRDAKNWGDLHQQLAQVGMRYERRGSGAVIFVGDVAVKSSAVDRNASLSKLEKRFGEFVSDENKPALKPIEPEPISPHFPRWQRYSYSRKKHFENKRATKIELDRKIAAERNQLFTRQRQQREELKRQNWRGRGSELNFMRSILAAQHAAEKSELQERISDMRGQWRLQYPPWPDFETWLNSRGHSADALRWRYRASDANLIVGKSNVQQPEKLDIRNYEPRVAGNMVFYDRAGIAEFIDRGNQVQVLESNATLAALQLAVQKFGGNIEIYGNNEFRKKCIDLCIQHNIHITNPDLQIEIEEEREKLTKSKISQQSPAAVQKLPPKSTKRIKPEQDISMVKIKLPDHVNVQLFKKYMGEFDVNYFDYQPMQIALVDDGRKFTLRFKKSPENKITTAAEEQIISGRMRSAFKILFPLDVQISERLDVLKSPILQIDKNDLERSNVIPRTPARRLWHCATLIKILEGRDDILTDPYSGVARIQSQHAEAASKMIPRWGGDLFLRHGAGVLDIRVEPEISRNQMQQPDQALLPLSEAWAEKLKQLSSVTNWCAGTIETLRDGFNFTFDGDTDQAEKILFKIISNFEALDHQLGQDLLPMEINIQYGDNFKTCSFAVKTRLNLPASERRPVPTPVDHVQTENKTKTRTKTKTGRRTMRHGR